MDEEKWFYAIDGAVYGPDPKDFILHLYEKSTINGDAMVCLSGTDNWTKFREAFAINEAPPIPMDCLHHEYAVAMAISPLIGYYIGSFCYMLTREYLQITSRELTYFRICCFLAIFGWTIAGDENLLKKAIKNYPTKFRVTNLFPGVYLLRRSLILRRIYQQTNWVSEVCSIVLIGSVLYIFGL